MVVKSLCEILKETCVIFILLFKWDTSGKYGETGAGWHSAYRAIISRWLAVGVGSE
jgi:hypothetical protein